MEYIAIEKEGFNLIKNKIDGISKTIENHKQFENNIDKEWIENSKLAKQLNLSLRTLQGYRERGAIGYSMIGKKIYYKREEIESLLDSGKISVENNLTNSR